MVWTRRKILLEAHELGVDQVEALAGFSEKVSQQLVHTRRLIATGGIASAGTRAHGARRTRQARGA
jgi:hypothetical protein